MFISKERDSLVEIGRGIALCNRLHAVIPCRLTVVRWQVRKSARSKLAAC